MLLAHENAPHPYAVSLNVVEGSSSRTLGNTDSTVVAVHYVQRVDQEDLLERHEMVYCLHSQHVKADWKEQNHLSHKYSEFQ